MANKKTKAIKKKIIKRKKISIRKETFSPSTIANNQRSFTNFRGLCKGCGICIEICPKKCIKWSKEVGYYKTPAVDCEIEKCISCRTCETRCPDAAIKIEKLDVAEPLLAEPLKKKLLK
jgi:2-oxoglutarate ferredoxin oxidoreductase subunit delta